MSNCRRWAKRLTYTVVVVFFIYLFVGCFVVGPVARNLIVTEGSAFFKRPLRLRHFYFNPLSFEVQLNELELGDDRGESFVKIDLIKGNLQLSSITFGGVYLQAILVEGLHLFGKLLPEGKTNIDELLALFEPNADPTPKGKPVESKPLPIFVEQVSFKNFEFSFHDENLSPAFRESVGPFNMNLSNLDIRPQGELGHVAIAMDCRDGATFSANSTFQISPLQSKGELRLQDLQIQRGQAYGASIIDCRAKALVSFSLPYHFALVDGKPEVALEQAKVVLKALSARALNHPEFEVDLDAIELGFNASLLKKTIDIDTFKISGNTFQTAIHKDGSLALALPLPKVTKKEAHQEAEPPPQVSDPKAEGSPWTIHLPKGSIQFPSLKLIDHISEVEQTHELLGTQLTIQDFHFDSSSAPATIGLHTSIRGGGELDSQLKFDLLSQKGSMEFQLKDLVLSTYNAYLKHYGDMQLQGGCVNLSAKVQCGDQLSAQAQVQLTPTTFLLASSEEKFFGVSANVVGIEYEPKKGIMVDTVKIFKPEAFLVLDAQGRMRLPQPKPVTTVSSQVALETTMEKAPVATPPQSTPLSFVVKRIEIVDGSTFFIDQTVIPSFSTNVESFALKVTNISSDPTQKTHLDGSATLDEFGRFTFKGDTMPLNFQTLTQVDINLKAYNLSPISGYLHKYLGRELGGGLFNYEGRFNITDKNLKGQNNFVLDQFKLAGRVESPEAIRLPLDLAIALLTDSRGLIGLENIEIQGDYNKPGVKTGPLILQALGKVLSNLLTKAVTSPFTFLAKISGAGEELKNASFEIGQTTLSSDMLNKLESLNKILLARPLIKLNITSMLARQKEEQLFKYANTYLKLTQQDSLQDPMALLEAYQPADFEQKLRPLYRQALMDSAELEEQQATVSGNLRFDSKRSLGKLGLSGRGALKNEPITNTAPIVNSSDNTLGLLSKASMELDMEALTKVANTASLQDMFGLLYPEIQGEILEAKYTEAVTKKRMQAIESFFVKAKGISKERFEIKLIEDANAPQSQLNFDIKI